MDAPVRHRHERAVHRGAGAGIAVERGAAQQHLQGHGVRELGRAAEAPMLLVDSAEQSLLHLGHIRGRGSARRRLGLQAIEGRD